MSDVLLLTRTGGKHSQLWLWMTKVIFKDVTWTNRTTNVKTTSRCLEGIAYTKSQEKVYVSAFGAQAMVLEFTLASVNMHISFYFICKQMKFLYFCFTLRDGIDLLERLGGILVLTTIVRDGPTGAEMVCTIKAIPEAKLMFADG